LVTGSVNIRAGYIEWRAPRSPAKPKLNTARRYTNVVVSGTDTTAAKRTLSTRTGSPGSRIRNLIVETTNR